MVQYISINCEKMYEIQRVNEKNYEIPKTTYTRSMRYLVR